jgi:hypothetical protein
MSRPNTLTLAAQVLRDPDGLLSYADDRDALLYVAPRLLGIAVAGAMIFGGVVGSYRGGVQIAYAAVKMPFLLAIPLIVCLPAVKALYEACRVEAPYPRLAVAGLVAMARTAILAAALGPIVWLLYSVGLDYHVSIVLLAGTLALAGLPGLLLVGRALPQAGEFRLLATIGAVLLLGIVTAQTGWMLRPFVARPMAEVAFLRPVESDVLSSLGATGTASLGYYQDWEPESAGLVGRGLSTDEAEPAE